MNLAKYATVEIDVCEEHGAWLDAGELPRIVSRVQGRERTAKRSAVRRAKSSGKVSGVLWGPLAFLFN